MITSKSQAFDFFTALPQMKARDGIPDWNEVEAVINEWKPDAVVVGIPLNMDGTESQMSIIDKQS